MAGTPTLHERGRGRRPVRPPASGGVVSALGVAAGYGLVLSAIILFALERMFGDRGTAGRLAVSALTVSALVAGAAVAHARRSAHRRRMGG